MRCAVVATAVTAALGGTLVIAGLPVAPGWRWLLVVAWVAGNARELWMLCRGYRRCRRIRVEPGGVLVVDTGDGCCIAATAVSGSVVLRRLAWLRMRGENGFRHAELVRPNAAQSEQWRRFQVIWRHLGAGH